MARFEQYLYERTRPGLVPLSHVARTEHVSFYRTQTAHTRGAHGELEGRPPPRLRAVSVDEASFKKRQDYNTTICAPELGRAIELVRGRDGVGFAVWAGMLPLPVRRGVEVFCADMWEPYHEVAAAAFPKALRVADRFHVQRHANRALDDVRRELQHGPGRGWRKDLFGSRWALLRAKEDLTARDHDRLAALFARYPDLELAWRLKEDLRDFYRDSDQGSAGPALIAWCQRAEASGLPSYAKLAATIRQWKPEILGYFHDRVTNAFAEGVTNKIKCIKRIGFGYRNFERFRERVLVA